MSDDSENSIVSEATLQKLEEIQGLIDETYLYAEDVDYEALQDAIIHGYVMIVVQEVTVHM